MTRLPYLRPTWRAAVLAASALVMGAVGAGAGIDLLVWFATTVASLLVLALTWALIVASGDARVRVTRHTSPPQLQVGVPATTTLTWPLGELPPLAELVDKVPGAREVAGGHALEPTRRGAMELGPAFLRRRDPFGLFFWRTRVRGVEEVIVWPRTDAVAAGVFRRLLEVVLGTTGLPTPQIDDVALREYRHGDPLSRVYWKRAATGGTLLVRHDEPARVADVDLILIPGSPTRTDRAVDILAAAASALSGPERRVRLLTPAAEVAGDLDEVLDGLALAQPEDARLPAGAPMGILVVALGDPTAVTARELLHWLGSAGVDPESVFVFPVQPLAPAAAEVLAHVTVIDL